MVVKHREFTGMKTFIQSLAALLILAMASACEDNISNNLSLQQGNEIKVTAYADGAAQTKTGIIDKSDGGKSVVWKSGNSISLFVNSGDNGGAQLTTTSNGSVAVFTGPGSISGESNNYWGLYPYNASASCSGSAITTVLPATQSAYQGDVADNLLVTVGRSNNLTLYFKNACTIIGFTLSQENITKVTFSGRNDEYVAGEVTISMDGSNNLVVTPTANAVKTIEITPAESSTFATGATYYFAFLPQSFESGYTLTFTRNDNKTATYERTTAFNFAISTFYTMTNKDSGLSFSWPLPPNNEIWYKTTNNTIVNINGSVDFGANVITHTYNSFGRIVCDGNITKIENGAFDYSRICEITLPETVTVIGSDAFYDCDYLESIYIPDNVTSIGYYAFGQCDNLTTVHIPSSLTQFGNDYEYNGTPFAMCPKLSSFTGQHISSDGRQIILPVEDGGIYTNYLVFVAPKGLTSLTIGDEVDEIRDYSLNQCDDLVELTIGRVSEIHSIPLYLKYLYLTGTDDDYSYNDNFIEYHFVRSDGNLGFYMPQKCEIYGQYATADHACWINNGELMLLSIPDYDIRNGRPYRIPDSVSYFYSIGLDWTVTVEAAIVIPSSITNLDASGLKQCSLYFESVTPPSLSFGWLSESKKIYVLNSAYSNYVTAWSNEDWYGQIQLIGIASMPN